MIEIVVKVPDDMIKSLEQGSFCAKYNIYDLVVYLMSGTPLTEHLNKIKNDIGKYELDCRFADVSQTDDCTICNKNVFGSIYSIINKYIEGSDSE